MKHLKQNLFSISILVILLTQCTIGERSTEQTPVPVSPYDFPYGYPFPEYPTGGGSHPTLSDNYLENEPDPINQLKRIAQYALRLIQTNKPERAVQYLDNYLEKHPGKMDQEILFMRTMALAQLGKKNEAILSMKKALDNAGLPPQRFLAGPRRMLKPIHDQKEFINLWENWKDKLIHGPMLGDVSDQGAQIWVRTLIETSVRVSVSNDPEMKNPVIYGPVISKANRDYTAVVKLDSLKPNITYYYKILLGPEKYETASNYQTFRTYNIPGRPDYFKIAFGGCAGYVPSNEIMWDTIRKQNPRAFLTLGDNVYIDDPESPDQQQLMYYQRQSRPEFQRLISSSPIYSIWDDHDFAMDDSWGGPHTDLPYWKNMVWDIFRQNWVNPKYASVDRPGAWYDFQIADVHFIMLDTRYYRENAGRFGKSNIRNPTMLGPDQLSWLKNVLIGSNATFKVLVSSVPWHSDAKGKGENRVDGWVGYLQERERIFSWIDDFKIEGVLLISSDRHRSDAWLTERENGYDLYEFSSGQFTNQHTHPVLENSLFGYNEKPSFGLLHFDSTLDDPTASYDIVDIDGRVQHSITIHHSDLVFKQ